MSADMNRETPYTGTGDNVKHASLKPPITVTHVDKNGKIISKELGRKA
jgi:hypothetical protein